MLNGKWTYRSYLNTVTLVGEDAAAALALISGEGVFDLHQRGPLLEGSLGMGTGYALTVDGEVNRLVQDGVCSFFMSGLGIDGTATEGWGYDYQGFVSPSFAEAVDQVRCLVGTVVRVKAHGPGSPAGVTASFVAVHRSDVLPERANRRFALTA